MWLRLQSCETLINEDNIVKIFAETAPKGTIGIYATLVTGERMLLGVFVTSSQAKAFLNSIQDHIDKAVHVVDIQPLVNLANLSS